MVGCYFSFLQPNVGCYFYFALSLEDRSLKPDIWIQPSIIIFILGLRAVNWPISHLKSPSVRWNPRKLCRPQFSLSCRHNPAPHTSDAALPAPHVRPWPRAQLSHLAPSAFRSYRGSATATARDDGHHRIPRPASALCPHRCRLSLISPLLFSAWISNSHPRIDGFPFLFPLSSASGDGSHVGPSAPQCRDPRRGAARRQSRGLTRGAQRRLRRGLRAAAPACVLPC
jgi:hypothetical protein